MEKQQKKTKQSDENSKQKEQTQEPEIPETEAYKQSEDHIIYADDTKFLLRDETTQQLTTRMEHYSILTRPRMVKIQWGMYYYSQEKNTTRHNKHRHTLSTRYKQQQE